MSRLPSIGFLYLAGTIVAFVLVVFWLVQPLWYEQPEPESSRSNAAYLVDMAYACEEPERTDRLRACLDRAFQAGNTRGKWQPLLATLQLLRERSRSVDGITSQRVGDAWLVARSAPTGDDSAAEFILLAYNEQTDPRDLELQWAGDDGLPVTIKPQYGSATSLSFHERAARQVLEGLAPEAPSMFLVQSPRSQNLQLVEARWL